MIDTQIQLAHDLAEAGEPDEALRIASNVLNENPDEARALFLASYVFLQAERFGMAYNLLMRASQIVPKREQVWNNLGMCAMKMNRIDEARKHLNRALQIEAKNYAAMNNLALIEVNEGNPEKALDLALRSLKIQPNQWDVLETAGYASLMLGNWVTGWDGYEAMVGNEKRRSFSPRKPNAKYWDGHRGVPLHVRGEQGIGDEISFASVIKDAAKHNPLIMECDKRLEGLFKRSFPEIPVYGTRFQDVPEWPKHHEFDDWCLTGSLCSHYRLEDDDFDGKPYLVADPERKLQWRALLDSLGSKKKVGIAWSGGLKDTHGARRSVELEQLLPILKQDATFVSLQYKTPHELADFEQKHGIKVHHWARATESNDYDDTAALVDELDLVISVQTAVVHLAGALGKPCWVLVPNKPHWRYATPRFMWAESVEMFRQGKTWDEPVKLISERLQEFCK